MLCTYIYNITIAIIYTDTEKGGSLGDMFLVLIFWVIGAVSLSLLVGLNKIRVKTTTDWIALTFSTPIPSLIFSFFSFLER